MPVNKRTAASIPAYNYGAGHGVRLEVVAHLNGEVKLALSNGDADEDMAVFLSAAEFGEMVDVMKGNRILKEVLQKEDTDD